jgi:hypothetical protein
MVEDNYGGPLWRTLDAGSYRGELLGLMAIHLILQAINEVTPSLRGLVSILSDCLGALCKVEKPPPLLDTHSVQSF